jgi:hypothetical protein
VRAVRREYRERVPLDLTTNEDALPAAEIQGVLTAHRVFYLGRQPYGQHHDVFAYMAFPEGGPVSWWKAASRRKQESYTFTGEYVDAWAAAVHYAVAMARQQIAAEMNPNEKE